MFYTPFNNSNITIVFILLFGYILDIDKDRNVAVVVTVVLFVESKNSGSSIILVILRT